MRTGSLASGPARAIAWVRVLRPRVPAFDSLETGDLVIASGIGARRRRAGSDGARGPRGGARRRARLRRDPGGDGWTPRRGPAAPPACRRFAWNAPTRSSWSAASSGSSSPAAQSWSDRPRCSRRSCGAGRWRAVASRRWSAPSRASSAARSRSRRVAGHHCSCTRRRTCRAPPRTRPATRRSRRPRPARCASRCPRRRDPAGPLVVLGREPVSELARVALPRVAGLLALELAREEAVRGAADRARQAEPMPSRRPALGRAPRAAARAGRRGRHADARACPRGRAPRDPAPRTGAPDGPARRRRQRGAPAGRRRQRRGRPAPGRAGRRSGGPARRDLPARSALPRTGPAPRPRRGPRWRPPSPSRRPPRLARADRLAIYRMLGALHRLPDGPGLARAVLEPLLDARPDVRRERLETLRALLAHGGVGRGGRCPRRASEHRRLPAAPDRGGHGLAPRRSGAATAARRRARTRARRPSLIDAPHRILARPSPTAVLP